MTPETKSIKDYLHLYLGCDCMYGELKWWLIRYDQPNNIITLDRDGGMGYPEADGNDIKLILRPLSDMTEEETNEHDDIEEDFDKRVNNETGTYVRWAAESTRYLLSKHFDLFGLIESGLAIDSTTIKTH